MAGSPKHHPHPHQHQHQLNSPSSTSPTSSTNSNAVVQHQQQQQQYNNHGHQLPHTPKPPTASTATTTTTRSEPANPYPTTFVQADTSSFKQVVQMLTGSSETAKQASSPTPVSDPNPSPNPRTHIPPVRPKSGFKLYERRNSLKNLKINPLIPVFAASAPPGFSPRKPEILSPSILDFPALVLSPVTPLIRDPFDRSGGSGLDREAEERAIKEKGFYLHPSPATTPREADPPRLLPLFPTTSPRVSSGSSSLSS